MNETNNYAVWKEMLTLGIHTVDSTSIYLFLAPHSYLVVVSKSEHSL